VAPAESELPDAYERALRLLGIRAHFRAELRRKLIRKGCEAPDVEAAIERLAAAGHLDDVALARGEADRLRRTRRLGPAAIAAELERKGAGETAIRAALGECDTEDEGALASEAARRWLATHRGDPSALGRHLARKGFARHVIFRILNELLPDAETPESD